MRFFGAAESPDGPGLSLATKTLPSWARSDLSNPVAQSTSPIPLPSYAKNPIAPSNPIPKGIPKITPIPPPVLPPLTNRTAEMSKDPEKKKVTPVPLPPIPPFAGGKTKSTKKKPFILNRPTYELDYLPEEPTSPSLAIKARARPNDDLVSIIEPRKSGSAPRLRRGSARKSTGDVDTQVDSFVLEEQMARDREVLAEERRRWKALMRLS
ncbi:hypothetical protein GQ53DRAFT_830186 [Thozetella sp. PMI_491]|nr:hypothetical protein GQ53DRAFT_830186 [Thozetella sp. PMI_491]